MPEIPDLPEWFKDLQGVEMHPPPLHLQAQVTAHIEQAMATLAPDQRGAITWVATNRGVNLAVVQRVQQRVEVVAYVGKLWGRPIAAGIVGKATW